MDEDPCSTRGTIKILERLHQYVPEVDGKLWTTPGFGDGLSVLRMIDAKRARSSDLTPAERLEGIEPVPQEMHHRGLNLQVSN